jgi:protein MpaA
LKKEIKILSKYLFALFLLAGWMTVSLYAEPTKNEQNKEQKANLCQKINSRFKQFKWDRIICNPQTWIFEDEYKSSGGHPLLFREFKPQQVESKTLVMCGIHGNELSTVYLCMNLARELIFDNPAAFSKSHVVIAPIVNPDGFLSNPPVRQNGRGIDLNRNFPTKDFSQKAMVDWQKRTGSSKGKYPGEIGGSEIETQFQMMLIERFKPDKIIAIHAPYGWIDFDLPDPKHDSDESDGFNFNEMLSKSREIAIIMSQKSRNFKMKSFGVFPGSLGNYAAKEKGIPVYTLELPSSDPNLGDKYWKHMKNAVMAAIQYNLVRISKL